MLFVGVIKTIRIVLYLLYFLKDIII